MFARRASWDLATDPVAEALARRRAAGQEVLDLTASNPTQCGLEDAGLALRREWSRLGGDARSARYDPDPRGAVEAREAVARHHGATGTRIAAEHVILTSGTSEGYAHLFRLLADPGDRVLAPTPSYPLFEVLAGLESVEMGPYPLRLQNGAGWRVDLEALAAAVDARTRAVLAVHPNNPTGSLLGAAEAAALRALCAERGLALVCDEVFADYRLPGAPAHAPRSLLATADAESGPLVFVLSGASKLLGLPQLKVSWILVGGPAALRDAAVSRLEVIADTYLSVSGAAQLALPPLLAEGATFRAGIARRVAETRACVATWTTSVAGAALLPADAGWYATVRLRHPDGGAPDEDALALRLARDAGVQVHPGWLFDLEPRDEEGAPAAHLVLSCLVEPEAMARALGHVAAAVMAEAAGR